PHSSHHHLHPHSFPTRRSSDLCVPTHSSTESAPIPFVSSLMRATPSSPRSVTMSVAPNSRASFWRDECRLMAMMRRSCPHQGTRSEEHTSELQSRFDLVCRLLL